MRYLAQLLQENPTLAQDELIFLLKLEKHRIIGRYIEFHTSKPGLFKRLAYTNSIYSVLFRSNKRNLLNRTKNFAWNKVLEQDFCVRGFNEKEFAGIIWRKTGAKVNLSHPKTLVSFFDLDKIYATRLVFSNAKDFEKRKAHLRPALHPSSLHPKLARAMVNLSGVEEGTILDPFCGTGGILIEAGLSGLSPIGSDIDTNMLEKARKNMNHCNLDCPLIIVDARILDANDLSHVDAIVTDPPYGKNTKAGDLKQLYDSFLEKAAYKTQKVVMSYPDFLKYKPKGWHIKSEYSYYIHKSLTKKIFVLESL